MHTEYPYRCCYPLRACVYVSVAAKQWELRVRPRSMVRRLHTGLEERSQVEACEGGGVRDRWAKPSGKEEAKKSRTRERVFIKIWIRQRGWNFAARDWFCCLGLSRSLVASSPCICPSHVDCRRLLLMRLSNPRFFKKLPSTEATAQSLLCCFLLSLT